MVACSPSSKFIAAKIVNAINDCKLNDTFPEEIVLTRKVFRDLCHDEDFFVGFDIIDNLVISKPQEKFLGINLRTVVDGNCQVISPVQYGTKTIDIQCTKNDYITHSIRSNLYPSIESRSFTIRKVSPAEERAIEMLREMITEAEFQKYLKYGFILVKGQSGDIYQIFRQERHTKVWRNGQCIEEICVRLKGVPYTDHVVAFKVMIESSEIEFKSFGNVYKLAA